MIKPFARAAFLLLLTAVPWHAVTGLAQGTAFTYQGRLSDGTNPANGRYDLTFTLYPSSSGGNATAGPVTNSSIAVSGGLFIAPLDFGAGAFTGQVAWLEIGVRTNGAGGFAPLAGRQQLTPTPYAIYAANSSAASLTGNLGASNLGGSYDNAVVFTNAGNNFAGNGGGLTNVNASRLGGLSASGFWQTSGNVGTFPGTDILGTLDNQPLELWVNGNRALKIAPTANTENWLGGAPDNLIDPGVVGATVAGGGSTNYLGGSYVNHAHGDFAVIGGGAGNTTSNIFSTVAGGINNNASGPGSVIGGGGFDGTMLGNAASGTASTVGGGIGGVASGKYTTVAGGSGNNATGLASTASGGNLNGSSGDYAFIGGGVANLATVTYATVGGGIKNYSTGPGSTIGGGQDNSAGGSSATVAGGDVNTANGAYSMVPGGYQCIAAGDYSFAAGRLAQANSTGAFIWCDALNQVGGDAGPNTFNVRSSGGVYIYTSSGATGVQIGAGGGSWSSISDRNVKENFRPVDARDVLARVTAMPLTTWNYKAQDKNIRHIGPMAQDFYSAFNCGEDNRHITTVDADGVALAAIQGLNEVVKEKDARIEALEKRLDEMEQIVRNLAKKRESNPHMN